MNQKARTVIFTICGILVLVGAALFLTHLQMAAYVFAVGAAGVAVCFLSMPTEGMDFRRRRLHRFNVIASLLMVGASYFMFKGGTEWILCLTIAAILMLYSSFVSGKEE